MNDHQRLYIIGAACWLLSDLLSDAPNMALLRNLKAVIPNADYVALASLQASEVADASRKYERALTNRADIKEHFPDMTGKELREHASGIVDQFALSADYLYNWLTVAFKMPSEDFGKADDAIVKAIDIVQGNRAGDIDILLQWIDSQPSGAVALETVRNKAIQIKNQ